jgi:glutamyl endopeptidase
MLTNRTKSFKTLFVCLGLALMLALSISPALATGKAPHTPVFSDGTEGAAPETGAEAGALVSKPFTGSGDMTELAFEETGKLAPELVKAIEALPPVSAPGSVETVIGMDTRIRAYTTTYPARATALVTFTGGYCTGWFYGPNIVATAGHCVHTGGPGGSWRANVRVYPGYNAGSAPYGSYAAKWLASVTGWTGSSNAQYDYGVIKLSTNVGNTVGWFGYFWQTASLTGLPTVISGYAGDKSPAQSQWLGVDQVRTTATRQVFYKNDTFGGMSGSAVWNDRNGTSGPYAFAIHAYGYSTQNGGTRIVEAVFNNMQNWKAAP